MWHRVCVRSSIMVLEALLGLFVLSAAPGVASHGSASAMSMHAAASAVATSARADGCAAAGGDRHDAASVDARIGGTTCLAERGRLVDALKVARVALADAVLAGDDARMSRARAGVESLLDRLPHVRFAAEGTLPADLEIRFDGRPVPAAALSTGQWSVDPGPHTLLLSRTVRGARLDKPAEISVPEATTVVVSIAAPSELLASNP